MSITPPLTENELLNRATALAGQTLGEVAATLGWAIPTEPRKNKGWIGELAEAVLGADGGSRPQPDFSLLGIELKTIPLNDAGRPRESTHVCTANLTTLHGQMWETSLVRHKLSRVLWVPIVSAADDNFGARRFDYPWLWSPTSAQETVLREDWEEIMELMATGGLAQLDARLGTYLQIRPKAAHGRSLTVASDARGTPALTLPRGFYLRPSFTHMLLEENRDLLR
jgi:DNA mismatch repair protein MutH